MLVLIFGQTVRGTRGWFQLFGFGIQPVEIAKFSAIIWLAWYFSKHARNIDLFKNILMSGLWIGGLVFLVLMQPDFGSALTMLGIWFLMLIVLGIRKRHLSLILGLAVSASTCAWLFLFKEYQKDRILVFLDPSRDPLGRGYNITQAAIAVGGGQMWGRGLGYGSQSQLKFLPESQTDFIFAVLGEEFGFIGISILVMLWIIFFWRLAQIMKRSDNDFGALLVLGVMLLFFIQIMVNAGMNIGLAPVTGISLPFISYGGSFLIMSLIMIGMVQSVAIRR
jgi:rod shape determining protein RodA